MRKLVVSEFVTLDGVMQAPGGADEDTEGGFTHGGWTHPYWHDDIGMHFGESMAKADTFLLGRKTWEIHGTAFDSVEGEDWIDELNAMKKYVVSTTLTDTSIWRNSTIISDNVVEQIRALKEQDGQDIYVDGSSVLVHTLTENDLVDEYSLLVYPIVLGSGKKVFPDGQRVNLKLVESRPFPSGVVLMRYVPDRGE